MSALKSRIQARESLQGFPFVVLKDFSSLFDSKVRLGHREDDPRSLVNETYIRVLRRLRCAGKRFSRHRAPNLGELLNQPAEIFYEIVGYLHPLDLWHLSYVNKHLRALFSSITSRRIWNLAFKCNHPIPPCPPDMPPLKWADLLFGPARCQRCGIQKVPHPDMNWRRRLCMSCSSDWSNQVFDADEGDNPRKLKIEGEGHPKSSYDPRSYEDVQSVADLIGALAWTLGYYWRSDSARGTELEKDPATKDIVASLYVSRQKYEMWMEFIKGEDTAETEAQISAILQMVAKHLRREGHQEQHVQQFLYSRALESVSSMFWRVPPKNRLLRLQERGLRATERYIRDNWSTKFKAWAEGLLYEIANLRAPLLTERANNIRAMWSEYVTSLDANSQCAEIPDIVLSEPFAAIVNDPSNRPIEEEQVAEALAPFAERWLFRTMEDLFAVQQSKPLLYTGGSLHPPHTYSINSAASVFLCLGCEASFDSPSISGGKFIGWYAAVAHLLEDSFHFFDLAGDPPFRVNEPGCVAARSLLELLGLDPRTTLAGDMDRRDMRFTCRECEEASGRSVPLSWRACVAHVIEFGDQSHSIPSWRVMSLEEVLSISDAE